MKKFLNSIIIVCAIFALLTLSGCPAPTPPPPPPDPTPTPVTTVTPPPPLPEWWPARPTSVPLEFVYCPLPGPGGAPEEDKWRTQADCPYDPFVKR